jgi:hypothetical protein
MTEQRVTRVIPLQFVALALALCGGAAVGCGDDATAKEKDSSDAGAHALDSGKDNLSDSATGKGSLNEPPTEFLADAGDGWKTLVTGHWELEPNKESYRCVRYTLPKDVYVSGLRPVSPRGTHHTVLTLDDNSAEPDGITTCTAQTNAARAISASGVATNAIMLPDGVGMHLRAGQQLLLNLHLFNVSEQTISGTSGTLIKIMDEADVEQTAEAILAGTLKLDIPVGGPTVQTGQCTFMQDATVFAVGAHMHQLGIHLKATAKSSIDGEVVLHNGDYTFDEQTIYPTAQEVRMKAGDTIQVDCTYQNTTNKTVNFGDSSLAEMCFAALFRYPASDQPSFICVN